MAAAARPVAADAIRRAPAEIVLMKLLYLDELKSLKPRMSSRPLRVLSVLQLVELYVHEIRERAPRSTSFPSPKCS